MRSPSGCAWLSLERISRSAPDHEFRRRVLPRRHLGSRPPRCRPISLYHAKRAAETRSSSAAARRRTVVLRALRAVLPACHSDSSASAAFHVVLRVAVGGRCHRHRLPLATTADDDVACSGSVAALKPPPAKPATRPIKVTVPQPVPAVSIPAHVGGRVHVQVKHHRIRKPVIAVTPVLEPVLDVAAAGAGRPHRVALHGGGNETVHFPARRSRKSWRRAGLDRRTVTPATPAVTSHSRPRRRARLRPRSMSRRRSRPRRPRRPRPRRLRTHRSRHSCHGDSDGTVRRHAACDGACPGFRGTGHDNAFAGPAPTTTAGTTQLPPTASTPIMTATSRRWSISHSPPGEKPCPTHHGPRPPCLLRLLRLRGLFSRRRRLQLRRRACSSADATASTAGPAPAPRRPPPPPPPARGPAACSRSTGCEPFAADGAPQPPGPPQPQPPANPGPPPANANCDHGHGHGGGQNAQ